VTCASEVMARLRHRVVSRLAEPNLPPLPAVCGLVCDALTAALERAERLTLRAWLA
jgi:hypothetical protein